MPKHGQTREGKQGGVHKPQNIPFVLTRPEQGPKGYDRPQRDSGAIIELTMNRWLFCILTFVVISSLGLWGCSSPENPTGSTTSGAASSETDKPTTTGSTGGASTTTGTTENPEASKAPEEAPLPDMPKDGDDVAVLETGMGKIVIMFYPTKAPLHVENFMNLAKSGFYNGTRFHRCIAGFMIQGGDPKSKDLSKAGEWGTGGHMGPDGKEITVRAEFNDIHHGPGIVSMARSANPDSASSQFFIVVGDSPNLDHSYSAFGKVVSGLDIAQKIVATGDPAQDGKVEPGKAVLLKSVKIEKWPIK